MSIVLQFTPDPEEMAASREEFPPPDEAGPGLLCTTWFRLPVEFVVDGAALIPASLQGHPIRVALLGLGVDLDRAVTSAVQDGQIENVTLFETGFALAIQQRGTALAVRSSITGATAVAPRAALQHAVDKFNHSIAAYLEAEIPGLAREARLEEWFDRHRAGPR